MEGPSNFGSAPTEGRQRERPMPAARDSERPREAPASPPPELRRATGALPRAGADGEARRKPHQVPLHRRRPGPARRQAEAPSAAAGCTETHALMARVDRVAEGREQVLVILNPASTRYESGDLLVA